MRNLAYFLPSDVAKGTSNAISGTFFFLSGVVTNRVTPCVTAVTCFTFAILVKINLNNILEHSGKYMYHLL